MSVTVNVRLDPDEVLNDVDRWAELEHRTRSQMIRVLLLEALAERKRIESTRG
jgi:hypothetical protein